MKWSDAEAERIQADRAEKRAIEAEYHRLDALQPYIGAVDEQTGIDAECAQDGARRAAPPRIDPSPYERALCRMDLADFTPAHMDELTRERQARRELCPEAY